MNEIATGIGPCHVHDDVQGFAVAAAKHAEGILARAVEARGVATVALAGGTTPRAVHRAWAGLTRLPWARIQVFFGDERCVQPDDPESNYRVVLEDLLTELPMPGPTVHRMLAEDTDHARAARRYAALVPDRLDLLMLGMGADGHVASLFPGDQRALAATQARVLHVKGPKPPIERLTVTPPVLQAAREVQLLVRGADKSEALLRAREGAWDPLDCPAQLVRRAVLFTDSDALEATRSKRTAPDRP
jgi:6-phosphogluconolactonase